jgi:hypothetical protein
MRDPAGMCGLISRAPRRASILLMAFETVALESFSSAAAPSGSPGLWSNLETMNFKSFYF